MSYAKEIVTTPNNLSVSAVAPALAEEIRALKQAQVTDPERNFQYLKYFSAIEPLHTEQHKRFLEKYGLSNVFETVYRLAADDPTTVSYEIPGELGMSVVQERLAHNQISTPHDWQDVYSLVPGAVHSYMYKLCMHEPEA